MKIFNNGLLLLYILNWITPESLWASGCISYGGWHKVKFFQQTCVQIYNENDDIFLQVRASFHKHASSKYSLATHISLLHNY